MKQRLREIEAELAAVEALVAEKARLERVLAAPPFTDAGAGTQAPYAPPARTPRREPGRRLRRAGHDARGVGRRARRGFGGGAAGVYALLRKGIEEGQVKTDELAGGQTGYRIAAQPETAFPAPAPAAPEPEPAEPAADVS